MDRDKVLNILREKRESFLKLSVKSLALFGSVARGEAGEDSDVDILVEFEEEHPKGLFEFIAVKNYLEDILGCRVDLVMKEGLRKEFREQVLKEAIRAA